MKNQILTLLSIFLFLSCGERKKENILIENNTIQVENADEQNERLQNSGERFIPEEKETVEFDTIISSRNLSVSIQSRFIDSYVVHEYDSDGVKHVDKYRDSEKQVVIKNVKGIIVDTTFKKNDFVNLAGQDFLKTAQFHKYWFNEIKNNTIEFFGVISVPETDWSFAFYHYFDVTTGSFKVVEHSDEEE